MTNNRYIHDVIGYNYRMTEIECAIGIEQIKKLPSLINQRLDNVAFLDEKLSVFPAFDILPPTQENSVNTYYVYPIKFIKFFLYFKIMRVKYINSLYYTW